MEQHFSSKKKTYIPLMGSNCYPTEEPCLHNIRKNEEELSFLNHHLLHRRSRRLLYSITLNVTGYTVQQPLVATSTG